MELNVFARENRRGEARRTRGLHRQVGERVRWVPAQEWCPFPHRERPREIQRPQIS